MTYRCHPCKDFSHLQLARYLWSNPLTSCKYTVDFSHFAGDLKTLSMLGIVWEGGAQASLGFIMAHFFIYSTVPHRPWGNPHMFSSHWASLAMRRTVETGMACREVTSSLLFSSTERMYARKCKGKQNSRCNAKGRNTGDQIVHIL